MGENKPYLRVVAFAGVLILVGGLVLGLFNEARAVDMAFQDPADSVEDDQEVSFTTHITVPDNERVPIDKINAVVEQQESERSDKVGADVVSRAGCTMTGQAGHTCESSTFDPSEGDGITQIEIANFYTGQVGYAYRVDASNYFGYDSSAYFTTTSYGYDDQTRVSGVGGYGYGHDLGSTSTYNADQGDFDGYGYGYSGDGNLIIEVNVTVSGGNLGDLGGSDTFYLTVLANTGSSTLGDLSTPWTEFQVSDSGDNTPGGSGAPGGGTSGPTTVDLGASFDADADETIEVTDLPAGYDNLRLTLAQACDDCSINMETHGTSPPSGTSALANGWRAVEYVSLWVEGSDGNELEGYIDSGSIEFEVDADELDDEDPQQLVLTHHIDGTWQPEEIRHTNDADDDPLDYNGTISGFSVFAQAVDSQEPSITNPAPTGDIRQTSPSIAADWDDNRAVDTESLELTIDGSTADDTSGTLTTTEDGFTYTPGTALDEGEHEVEATVSDESGLSTTETWTFTIEEGASDCPELPSLTNPQPADGATDVTRDDQVSISVTEGSCPLASGELVVAGETVATSIEDGQLTGEIPDSVEAGEQVNATATISDEEGNDQAREWSFTMSEDLGEAPGEEGGGGALVWVIVALVVLAIVGVGAYFYSQQE
jgi:PGF-pre-PGF domain-containing protein